METDLFGDRLKAFVFDMDDTLVVEEASAKTAFLETCKLAEERFDINPQELHATVRETCRGFWYESPARAFCVKVGISSWEGLWAQFEGDNPDLKTLREWGPFYRSQSWDASLRRHGVDDPEFAEELARAFPENRRKYHVVYDDVAPFFDAFGESYSMALVTNGAPDLQHEKIEKSGIGKYFKEIMISGEVGFGKPDPRIFRLVLDRLGVPAQEAVMIGNSLSSDIQGAQSVEMKSVWVNRESRPRDDMVVPELEVRNLAELREAFQRGTGVLNQRPPVELVV